jgi:hypothetical protein
MEHAGAYSAGAYSASADAMSKASGGALDIKKE